MGESLLIPYLLSLGVSNSVANLAWLINPLFGLFLQPMVGRASDTCTSSLGRRRPFLALFHLGSVCGLLTVVFAADAVRALGWSVKAVDGDGPSLALVLLIFAGFATADMCHDLLLMPARALLNDQLPDEQTDQGNASFALISSLGSIIGLCMVIAPLDDVWPLSVLGIPIRATFVAAAALVMTSNVLSFFIAGNIDTPLAELRERQQLARDEEEERDDGAADDGAHRSPSSASTPRAAVNGSAASSPSRGGGGGSDSEVLTLSSILFVYRVVPRPLVAIWFCQFFFWSAAAPHTATDIRSAALLSAGALCTAVSVPAHQWPLLTVASVPRCRYAVLHVNIWTSSFVAVDIYGAQRGDEFDKGVRHATLGLLIQAVVSFAASSLMTRANAAFGVTNFYHFSALLYSAAVCVLFFQRTYAAFLLVMAVTGVALPALYSSPFVLIEVHAGDSDSDDEDEDAAAESDSAREQSERREEHRALDIVALHKPAHSSHTSAPAALGAEPKSPLGPSSARPLRHIGIVQAPSHGASASASASGNDWSVPAKETDALLPSSARRAAGSSPTKAAAAECDESSDSVYDMEFLDEWRGVLTGVYNVTMIIAQILVGLTSGLMIDLAGDIRVVFLWSGALCFAVHSAVVVLGLSKPTGDGQSDERVRPEEEEEQGEAAAVSAGEARDVEAAAAPRRAPSVQPTPRRPPLLVRLSTVADLPPLIDYRSFSTRALPGGLRSYVAHVPGRPRHVRQHTFHTQHAMDGALEPPVLQRSRSAPAIVLLARPKAVVRGVPVFQAAAASGGGVSGERLRLERLRERMRLFAHLPSPALRRRHERPRAAGRPSGTRPLQHVARAAQQQQQQQREEHKGRDQRQQQQQQQQQQEQHEQELEHENEKQLWYSGAQAHHRAVERRDNALHDALHGAQLPAAGGGVGAVHAVLASPGVRSAHEAQRLQQRSFAFTFEAEPMGAAASLYGVGGASAQPQPHPLRSSFSLSDLHDLHGEGGAPTGISVHEAVPEGDAEGGESDDDGRT